MEVTENLDADIIVLTEDNTMEEILGALCDRALYLSKSTFQTQRMRDLWLRRANVLRLAQLGLPKED